MKVNKLVPPCSYQGGKQKLAKKIIDVIFNQNEIDENTKFYDLCCGSGSITLELINRGINPKNIIMVDKSNYGRFWYSVSNNTFDLNVFKSVIKDIPDKPYRKQYLLDLVNSFDETMINYHYLLLQSGSFGSKALYLDNGKWKHHGFRDYWMPTETSVRRSPCNPMQPEPCVMFNRVKDIVDVCSGNIRVFYGDVMEFLIKETFYSNSIIYIDPPYMNTTGYKDTLNIYEVLDILPKDIPTYVSEFAILSDNYEFVASGKSKGNITGVIKKKRKDDLLNIFNI